MNAGDAQSRQNALEYRLNQLIRVLPRLCHHPGIFDLPTLNVLQLLGQTWFIGGLNYIWGFLSFIGQFFKIHINPFKAFGVLKSNTRNRLMVKH